jgi:hypothetical protein
MAPKILTEKATRVSSLWPGLSRQPSEGSRTRGLLLTRVGKRSFPTHFHDRVGRASAPVALVCTRERILKLFRITGLAKVFGIHLTVDQAIAASKGRR